jgi:hypothetical protein
MFEICRLHAKGKQMAPFVTQNKRRTQQLTSKYIESDVKLRRLEWLGHLTRIENNIIPKIALDAKQDKKRKAGRPKLRWSDDLQVDLRITGIKGWKLLIVQFSPAPYNVLPVRQGC